jgi:hypothetical protein
MPSVLAALAKRFPLAAIHVRGDVRRVSPAEESFDASVRLGPWKFTPVPMHLLRTPRHRGSPVLDAMARLLEERLR